MELTCHLSVFSTSLTFTIEGLGEEVELINTRLAAYVMHIRNKLSLISARKNCHRKFHSLKFLFDRIHFNVSAGALFHCGRRSS